MNLNVESLKGDLEDAGNKVANTVKKVLVEGKKNGEVLDEGDIGELTRVVGFGEVSAYVIVVTISTTGDGVSDVDEDLEEHGDEFSGDLESTARIRKALWGEEEFDVFAEALERGKAEDDLIDEIDLEAGAVDAGGAAEIGGSVGEAGGETGIEGASKEFDSVSGELDGFDVQTTQIEAGRGVVGVRAVDKAIASEIVEDESSFLFGAFPLVESAFVLIIKGKDGSVDALFVDGIVEITGVEVKVVFVDGSIDFGGVFAIGAQVLGGVVVKGDFSTNKVAFGVGGFDKSGGNAGDVAAACVGYIEATV